ncbi:uncharacterized protein [Hyperolius riggenbachi]|uniref:uncharacterized protein n=1 Tax=Hyperolius riggenbachi TaxID=752182 RepID=UPI0035A31EB5
MAEGQKSQNAGSFIKSNFKIIENSILFAILFMLEKLMDLEFKCPKDNILGLVYGMVFFFVPTGIVAIVAHYFDPIPDDNGNEDTQNPQRSGKVPAGKKGTQNKTTKGSCCKSIICCLFNYKAPIFWLLIIITDGRYLECLVKSAANLAETNRTRMALPVGWTAIKDNYLPISQITGLLLILVVVLLIFCLPKSKCKCAKRCNDYIKEEERKYLRTAAKEEEKEFINALVIKIPDAEFQTKCKNLEEDYELTIVPKMKGTRREEVIKMIEIRNASQQERQSSKSTTGTP